MLTVPTNFGKKAAVLKIVADKYKDGCFSFVRERLGVFARKETYLVSSMKTVSSTRAA